MRYLHRAALPSERVGDQHFKHRTGIGRTQDLVMRLIADAGDEPCTQQAIGHELSLTKSAVSRRVDNARRQGWLTIGVSHPLAGSTR